MSISMRGACIMSISWGRYAPEVAGAASCGSAGQVCGSSTAHHEHQLGRCARYVPGAARILSTSWAGASDKRQEQRGS